jgi:hypothetical protein
MKKIYFTICLSIGFVFVNLFGQKPTIYLTFTAEYYNQYVPLDSIYIENLTQGGDTMLYSNDTVLVLGYTVNITAHPVLRTESL